MTYDTPGALRQAIEDRIRLRRDADVQRARRRIVFERVLARLSEAPDEWVLKGGFALEARLPGRARATRDLDLAIELAERDEGSPRGALVEALARDVDGDRFAFAVTTIRALPPTESGRSGWRVSIQADLDGRRFDTITADIVARTTELGHTERWPLASSLAFAGVPDLEIGVVDLDHHFAEKLAAFVATYGDRENTRVKDLTDLVLLVETGLEPTRRLRDVVDVVFSEREEAPPAELPPPPRSWAPTYALQAEAVGLDARTLDVAYRVVSEFWLATAEQQA
jgi:predicted nucleotidyltransferase component of viral defense system